MWTLCLGEKVPRSVFRILTSLLTIQASITLSNVLGTGLGGNVRVKLDATAADGSCKRSNTYYLATKGRK